MSVLETSQEFALLLFSFLPKINILFFFPTFIVVPRVWVMIANRKCNDNLCELICAITFIIG